MKQDFISVIMPVYNAARYLSDAIDSILTQTYYEFEFIIINDGSTDNSEEIIKSYNDDRILYLKNEKNLGICHTLNRGLDIAKGEYVARMDSDDIALPQRFKKQIEYLKSHPDIGVLGSDIIIFGEGINESRFTLSHNKWQCKADLIFNSCTAHPSVMMRNEILQKHNIRYNDEYRGLEDYELWWRLSKITHITNYNKPLLKYRIHSQQVTKNNESFNHLQKRKNFIIKRMNDLDITPSINEVNSVMLFYSINNKITTNNIIEFINLCKQIIFKFNYSHSKLDRHSNKTICNNIISFSKRINNKLQRKTIIKYAKNNGIFSLFKFLYSYITI